MRRAYSFTIDISITLVSFSVFCVERVHTYVNICSNRNNLSYVHQISCLVNTEAPALYAQDYINIIEYVHD